MTKKKKRSSFSQQLSELPKYTLVSKDQAKGGGVKPNKDDVTNPIKAIAKKCRDCSGGMTAEVDKCAILECPLLPFRFGQNPFRTPRKLDDETAAQHAERLKAARNK